MDLKHPPKLSWSELFNSSTFNFLEFLLDNSVAFTKKYGDIIRLTKKQYLITGPNAFKYILKTKPENFTKENRTYHRIKHLFGDGLLVTEGSLWDRHRRHLHDFFHRDRLEFFANIMVKETEKFIQRLVVTKKFDCVKEMSQLTLNIAFQAFAHHQPTVQELKIINGSILQGTPHLSHAIFLSPFIPTFQNLRFFWSMRHIDHILKKIIKERTRGQYDDYLELLLSLQEKETTQFSEREVIDEFKTILLTGHETTACALIWTWHLLQENPLFRDMLEDELANVLGERNPTLEDCANLPITKAIFLETLRLYPPIWCLPRKSIQTDKVDGFDIPAGMELILNIHALHRNPKFWDNPHQFYPPRFLGTEQRHPYAFIPFNVGMHACIGSQFAITEGILLIAMIAKQFRFKPKYNPKNVKAHPYLSLRPPKKLIMQPILRKGYVCK